jgi:hypothetical protein
MGEAILIHYNSELTMATELLALVEQRAGRAEHHEASIAISWVW